MTDFQITYIRIYNREAQDRAFGLIGFAVGFQGALAKNALLRIDCGDAHRTFRFDELLDRRKDTSIRDLRFSVMTHLLPNGPASVVLKQVAERRSGAVDRIIGKFDTIVDNRGPLAGTVRAALLAGAVPTILPFEMDASELPYEDASTTLRFGPEAGEGPPLSFEPQSSNEVALKHLQKHGFCVLPFTIPGDVCDDLNARFGEKVRSGEIAYEWGSSERVQGMHRTAPGRAIWTDPRILGFLRDWFRDDPVACQTLYFAFGSQQRAHQDTIHLTPFPAGYMCGVWVALEDVQPESGELFVYPGSHRMPTLRASDLGIDKVFSDYSQYAVFDKAMEELLSAGGYQRFTYRPRQGLILVWHENLSHGGGPRKDMSKSRRSIVSHYFARGAVGFYDSRGEPAAEEDVVAAN